MCAGPVLSFSQDVTGIWRGYFISESGENYKLEFQVKQNASQVVSGVSYSYLDVRFYGKATMAGNFTKSSKNFRIREIRTVEIKSLGYGNTCIMNYNLTYSRSGKEEFLEGSYLGKTEVKSGENPYEWGECGGGKVFLRKVATSEFYVEPFLRKNTTNTPKTNTLPPAVNKNQPKQLTPPPVVKKENSTDPPATSNKPAPSVTEPPKRNIPPPVKTDTIAKIPAVPSPAPPPVAVPQVLKTRQNELIKTLVVNSPDVTLKIFDNGEIDDDSVSVYLDNKLVLSNKRLTTSPLTLKLKMDEENTDHEVVMVAENLGRIPPNTSLMIVEAGSQRFELRITSTEQKNAVIRFQYRKP
ncbi:MAG: hypothetical protein ABW019_09095 [Chitinophagaceae bacterium]